MSQEAAVYHKTCRHVFVLRNSVHVYDRVTRTDRPVCSRSVSLPEPNFHPSLRREAISALKSIGSTWVIVPPTAYIAIPKTHRARLYQIVFKKQPKCFVSGSCPSLRRAVTEPAKPTSLRLITERRL